MASLGDLMMRVGLDLGAFNASLAGVPTRVSKAAADVEKAWAPVAAIGSSLVGFGAGLTAAITAPLVGIGAAAVSMGEKFNLAQQSFATMLGSGEKAKKFLDELKQFAASTPFEFPDLLESAKRMMAFGFEASQVVPMLRTIGDAVSALGGGSETIQRITKALGDMQSKGKVSAQEMNQLAENGIGAWKMLADNIGVSIPEAMKLAEKGAISASVAIPAILDGMNRKFSGQMDLMSKTLTGTWSNFKDQISLTLGEIGQTLTPILTQLLQAAMPLLDWAKGAAEWFARLPEPIQQGAAAFAAVAAVMGPLIATVGGLMAAFAGLAPLFAPGGMLAALGVTAGGFAAVAGAIPLVVAALVALGAWVYQNWEPIKAVLTQAWDGVKEAWLSVWGWAVPFLTGAWDLIAGSTTKAWDYIGGFLGKVWEGIKASAQTIWGGIVSVFQTFLEWAAKIPGVNKLLNLDDAWASAKKLQEQTEKTTKATQNLAKTSTSTGKTLKTFAVSAEELAKQQKKAETEAKKLEKAAADQEHAHVKNNQATRQFLANLDEWQAKHRPAIEATKALNDAINAMQTETVATGEKLTALSDAVGTQLTEALKAPINPITNLESAYKKLGIESSASVQKHAEEARIAYEDIKNSGLASARDLDEAWVRYEEARIAAAKAAGQEIPNETQAALDKMKEKLDGKPARQPWSDWSKQVSTIITDLSKSITDTLFEGDMSWAEKGKKILGDLGQAVVRSFVEPATRAIGDLIAGALTDLIGGKGFGGVLDRVKDLGGAIGGVFGGGGGAAGTAAGGAASAGGGATGGAGSAVGAGVTGIVGAVGGVVSAVSGVIGNFQMAGMNKSLDLIEHEVRYSQIHLSYILENTNKWLPYLEGIHKGVLEFRGDIAWQIGEMNDRSRLALDHLGDIARQAARAADRLLDNYAMTEAVRDAVKEIKPSNNVTIHVSGAASPQATADAIALRLRTQVFA